MTENKSWDPVWEKIYNEREWGKYPPEDLIRFTARNFYKAKNRKDVKILEIGCGPGANIWYLAREGFSVYGIDGSKTSIKQAGDRLKKEGLSAELEVGDVHNLSWPDNYFDAVIDIECLSCNSQKDSKEIMAEVYRVLKHSGKFFSIAAKSNCWGSETGVKIDQTTRRQVEDGPYAGVGPVRFADLASLKEIFSSFHDQKFEYISHSALDRSKQIKQWIITGEKK